MRRIFAKCPLVLIICVQLVNSVKMANNLDDWIELFNQMDMFKNLGEKHIQYMSTVYPSSRINAIGQVGGLDTLQDGNLLVFHRGERSWAYDSFNDNDFNKEKYGPIQKETLTLIDTEKSNKIASWGQKMFYMPHGLTVDYEGKIWLTDVALHQVFKFDLNKFGREPELTLGVAFKHGNDKNLFCKPTDVAVSQLTGNIYVSDGYCNKRVVEFDKTGKFIKTFEDEQNPMFVVHSVAIIETLDLICTVSREEGRIICFDIKSGNKVHEITQKGMLTVYAIKYDSNNQVLHAVTGDNHRREASGFTFDASKDYFGKFIEKWSANDRDLTRVHDLTISPDGSLVYLGQLNGEIDKLSYE